MKVLVTKDRNKTELHELAGKEYQEFINTNAPLVFQNSWWLELFRKWYHHKYYVRYYSVSKGNTTLAVLPIPIHKKGFLFSIVSVPLLTPYLGPVFSSESLAGKGVSLVSKVKEINSSFARVLKSYKLVISYPFSPWHIDLQPYKWAGFKIGVKYTYVINLDNPLNVIWSEMSKKRRNDIRRASRLNPEIVEDDINSFILLNNLTCKRQGKKYNLDKLWKLIFEETQKREQGKVWTAYLNNEPIASLFLVWDDERAYYIGGGINGNSQGIMSLLMWNAIKYSKERRLKIFDFEGSDIPSIEKYFREFGGEIKPVYYIQSKIITVIT